MNYLTFSFHFPILQVLLLRAGPQVGPGRDAGRASARGCRPQNRPRPGCRPGHDPNRPASWPAQAGIEAGPPTEPAGLRIGPRTGLRPGTQGRGRRRRPAEIGGEEGKEGVRESAETKWSSPGHSCVVDDGSEGRRRPESGPAVTRQWRGGRGCGRRLRGPPARFLGLLS